MKKPSSDASAEETEIDDGAEMLLAALTQGEIADGRTGLTPRQEEALYNEGRIPPLTEEDAAGEGKDVIEAEGEAVEGQYGDGFKFPPPAIPLPPQSHLKQRYHPVLEQVTRLMMWDGKLSVAQRVCPPPPISESGSRRAAS
jgi:small subunit ribosomal protein S7